MIVLWLVALVGGMAVAAIASRRAVGAALQIADGLGVSRGLIGVTLVAIGTDLPEIANSISASVTGHGDVNVGNATGSALTQVTLILAILIVAAPALVSTSEAADRQLVLLVGGLTVVATVIIAIVIRDGVLSRLDGALLVAIWAVSMTVISRWQRPDHVAASAGADLRLVDALAALGWLALVGLAATVVVRAFVELADAFGVPELVASTIVLALGTSLPELVVDWTAIRRGAAAMAIGDLFGSSLVDASLAIGIGPLIRSTEVSAEAVGTTLIVAVGVAAATIVWSLGPRRPHVMAALAFGTYAITTAAIVGVTGS